MSNLSLQGQTEAGFSRLLQDSSISLQVRYVAAKGKNTSIVLKTDQKIRGNYLSVASQENLLQYDAKLIHFRGKNL